MELICGTVSVDRKGLREKMLNNINLKDLFKRNKYNLSTIKI
jgi:hypothetical protein